MFNLSTIKNTHLFGDPAEEGQDHGVRWGVGKTPGALGRGPDCEGQSKRTPRGAVAQYIICQYCILFMINVYKTQKPSISKDLEWAILTSHLIHYTVCSIHFTLKTAE